MSTDCEACPNGRTSHQDVGSALCDPLPAGQFGIGATCPVNTYSESGAIECTECPSGKYSEIGASQCIECDFMYRLSNHCDVPYLGMILFSGALALVLLLILVFRRQYQAQVNRSKKEHEVFLHQLEDSVEEIERLEAGWKLDWTCLSMGKKLASGAYGDVCQAILNDTLTVRTFSLA